VDVTPKLEGDWAAYEVVCTRSLEPKGEPDTDTEAVLTEDGSAVEVVREETPPKWELASLVDAVLESSEFPVLEPPLADWDEETWMDDCDAMSMVVIWVEEMVAVLGYEARLLVLVELINVELAPPVEGEGLPA
jgi:hypothetical protein